MTRRVKVHIRSAWRFVEENGGSRSEAASGSLFLPSARENFMERFHEIIPFYRDNWIHYAWLLLSKRLIISQSCPASERWCFVASVSANNGTTRVHSSLVVVTAVVVIITQIFAREYRDELRRDEIGNARHLGQLTNLFGGSRLRQSLAILLPAR